MDSTKNKKNSDLSCSFCGSTEKDVNFLIEGDDAYICDVCTRNPDSKKYPFNYCSVMMKIGTGASWSCIGDRT